MESPHGFVGMDFLKKITNITKKPETFLGVQENVAKELTSLLKFVYDYTKIEEPSQTVSEALPELIIQGFDEEQIWQELELQNDFKVKSILVDVAKLTIQKEKLAFSLIADADEEEEEEKDEGNAEEWENDDLGDDEENDDLSDNKEIDDDETYANYLKGKNKKDLENAVFKANTSVQKRPKKTSVVDDRFFKLEEMNKFLEQEDNKDATSKKDIEESGDELDYNSDDVDLFGDVPEDKESLPKYADFFSAPCSDEDTGNDIDANNFESENKDGEEMGEEDDFEGIGEEDLGSESESLANKKKKVRFDLCDDNGAENDDSEPPALESNENKSEFEISQDRLKNKINHLEIAAMSEKPWQLKGEVSSKLRPENSLLEEVVDFQTTTRPAPIFTEETTMTLESIILSRIRAKKFNDVVRQVKNKPIKESYKKTLVLNEEKSKQGLADIYEQDYKAKLTSEQTTSVEHNVEREDFKKIRQEMASLFTKLDALANYHFMPKPAIPELRVITNVPAVNMEEVAPIATTSASLLAPEEIKAKQMGDLMSKQERTTTDKKRERRQKKVMQRNMEENEEKKSKLFEDAVPGFKGKLNKKQQEKLLKNVTKSKNVSQMKVVNGVKVTKSSTSFFSKLQDKTRRKKDKNEEGVQGGKVRKRKKGKGRRKSSTGRRPVKKQGKN